MSPVLGRSSLLAFGALGLLAGVLVAYQMTAGTTVEAPSLATVAAPAAPPTATVAAQVAPAVAAKAGIEFLDSRSAARADAPSSGGSLRVGLMLVFLAGAPLVWYLARKRQRAGKAPAARSLALIGTVKIAGRWQVALVKVPGKTLVLGATDKGLALLSELDDDVADELGLEDELVARIRPDDTVSVSPRSSASRVPTDPMVARTSRHDDKYVTPPPASEPFGRLLDQLERPGPSRQARSDSTSSSLEPRTTRERAKTDEALALRARLERHQAPH